MSLYSTSNTAETISEGIDLTGKTILITGVSSGIGFETMRVLVLRGARVIGTARSLEKAEQACERVMEVGTAVIGQAFPAVCELSEPDSIRALISSIDEPLDVIIANAGVMALPEKELIHSVEAHTFINHMGHFMLVNGLLHLLNPDGRVVVVASAAHSFVRYKTIDFTDLSWNRPYNHWSAYGYSKLANILYARELAGRLPSGQVANSLHPGIIESELWRHVPGDQTKYSTKTPAYGASASVYLAAHPDAGSLNGEYISGGKVGAPSAFARDDVLAAELWATSEQIAARL